MAMVHFGQEGVAGPAGSDFRAILLSTERIPDLHQRVGEGAVEGAAIVEFLTGELLEIRDGGRGFALVEGEGNGEDVTGGAHAHLHEGDLVRTGREGAGENEKKQGETEFHAENGWGTKGSSWRATSTPGAELSAERAKSFALGAPRLR